MLKKSNQKGFTIIEVLIVLAIAAVIMLVVFLAVPALQRNNRNTQRSNDASILGSAVNECLTNSNGVVASCDTQAEVVAAGALDLAKVRQYALTAAAPYNTAVITASADSNPDAIAVVFGRRCVAAGNASEPGSPRQFVVLYEIETTGNVTLRCVDS